MTDLRIGSKECPIEEILEVFKREDTEQIRIGEFPVISQWVEFAGYLDLPTDVFDAFIGQVQHKDKVRYKAIEDLLIYWSEHNTNDKANIGSMLSIIERNFKWEIVNDFLRKKIQSHANTFWNLDELSRNQLLNLQFVFLGRQTSLTLLQGLVSHNIFDEIINSIDNSFIVAVLQKNMRQIDEYQLPPETPNFISRSVGVKRKLSRKIFEIPCDDIFIFESNPTDDFNLSFVAKPNTTDVSGGQIDHLSVRFIRLEEEKHFAEIVKKTEKPVHIIKYEENNFTWILTIGSISVIRKCLSGEVEEINEDNLINKTLSHYDSKPFAICGVPGTGKSVLLARLANKIFQKYSKRHTIFLNFPNLFRHPNFSDIIHKTLDETKSIAELFGSNLKMNKFSKAILEGLIKTRFIHFEVFLDRFDEIPHEHIELAKHFLKALIKYPNLRIYLTFCPTLQIELEDHLQLLSCEIFPLRRDEMEFFLLKTVESQVCHMVLKAVDLLAKTDDVHIGTAGSPLQYFMLVEVYSTCTKTDFNTSGEITTPIQSLTQLYSKYMKVQHQKMESLDPELVKLLYYREAFNKLFHGNSNAKSIIQAINERIQKFTSTEKSYKAVVDHKTFLEYLLAQFIVENWEEANSIVDKTTLCRFIYRTLLATWTRNANDKYHEALNDKEHDTLKSILWKMGTENAEAAVKRVVNLGWKQTLKNLQLSVLKGSLALRHYVICYFLNDMMSADKIFNKKSSVVRGNNELKLSVCPSSNDNFCLISKDFISKVLISISLSFTNLFELTTELFRNTSGTKDLYVDSQTCQTILILAARQDDEDTFNLFCKLVETSWDIKIISIRFHSNILKNMTYEHTPLHEASKRGNYNLFKYLFNIYRNKLQSMPGLVQVCISDSSGNSDDVIRNKNKILRLLSSENIKYNFKSIEGSLLDGINVTLFTNISDMIGFTMTEKDVKWLYNFVVCYFTKIEEMDVLVNWLISKDMPQFLLCIYESQKSLVTDAVRLNVLGPRSLEILYKYHKFCLGTIMYFVKNCKNRHVLLKKMVDLVVDVNLDDVNDPIILHWADHMFEVDPMKYACFDNSDRSNVCQRLEKLKTDNVKSHYDELINLIKESQSITNNGRILYNSNEILGRGSFGIVYKGTFNGRPVAVKQIYFKAGQEEQVAQETKFLLESDGHENIIKCFHVHKAAPVILIALEICTITLEKWVDTYRLTYTKEQACNILHQITKGLDFLHDRHVVHLDINPQNILLNLVGDIKVKIADFGNSRILPFSNKDIKLEADTQTFKWMAPEVIHITSNPKLDVIKNLTTAPDIFSLGCVFYYVFSNGKHPFGENAADIKSNIERNSPCVRISHLKEPKIIHLFYLMTRQKPDARPTAAAVLKHPLFWSEKTMLAYLVSVSNAADQPTVTSEISEIMDKIEKYPLLKPYYEPATSKGWIRFLCQDVQAYVSGIGCKRKAYKGDLFFDLVRAIRNMQAHYVALPKNVQIAVGEVPYSFMKYWLNRFAIIFEIIWLNFESLKNDSSSALSEYYCEGYDFNCEEVSARADKIFSQFIKKQCTLMVLQGSSF